MVNNQSELLFKHMLTFFYVVIAFSFGTYILELLISAIYPISLYEEDGFIESLSAIIFFISAVVAMWGLLKVPIQKSRWVFLLIFTIGIFGFLDEVSFGERFFQVDFASIHGKKIDAVHDYLGLGYDLLTQKMSSTQLLMGVMIVMVGFGVLVFMLRKHLKRILFYSRATPLIGYCLLFIVLASILDLDLVVSEFLIAMEEVLELNAGWALLCAAFIQVAELRDG